LDIDQYRRAGRNFKFPFAGDANLLQRQWDAVRGTGSEVTIAHKALLYTFFSQSKDLTAYTGGQLQEILKLIHGLRLDAAMLKEMLEELLRKVIVEFRGGHGSAATVAEPTRPPVHARVANAPFMMEQDRAAREAMARLLGGGVGVGGFPFPQLDGFPGVSMSGSASTRRPPAASVSIEPDKSAIDHSGPSVYLPMPMTSEFPGQAPVNVVGVAASAPSSSTTVSSSNSSTTAPLPASNNATNGTGGSNTTMPSGSSTDSKKSGAK
jgi:hypothetical protein